MPRLRDEAEGRLRRSQSIFRSAESLPYHLIADIADFVSVTMHEREHRKWQRPSRTPVTNAVR